MNRMRSRRYEVPPLDQLLAFEAAARHLSFTRAGEELFLSQSAVSRQIQALESDLNARLFERRTRALRLTEQGTALYRVSQTVLQQLHETARRVRGTSSVRTVTVTTTPGFAALWLIPRLTGFTRGNPGIDVRISAANELLDMERSGVDVAIRYGPVDNARGLPQLFGEVIFPVCAPSLLADPARPLREPSDLRRHTLLSMDDTRAAWLDWEVWFHALGLGDLPADAARLHFSHYDQLIQAAVGGQGIALGRHPLVHTLLADGRLRVPFHRDVVSSRTYYMLQSSATRSQPHVQAFVAWLMEAAEPERRAAAACAAGDAASP